MGVEFNQHIIRQLQQPEWQPQLESRPPEFDPAFKRQVDLLLSVLEERQQEKKSDSEADKNS